MRALELIQYKLQPALDECALHQLRLHQARVEANDFDSMRSAGQAHLQMDSFAQMRKQSA